MDDMKKYLNEGEQLSHIHKYELNRGKRDFLFIWVFEPIDDPKAEYMAIPSTIIGTFAKEPFIGRGATHEEALTDCLSKIKGIPTDVILPPLAVDPV